MLYMIGAVTLDTTPFPVDEVEPTAAADFAIKPVLGVRPRREFMGEGEETLTLSGRLLPSKIGGLLELESLQSIRRAGEAVPVMRGDGTMLGWFVITQISSPHGNLERDGIGFTIDYRITMARTEPDAASTAVVGSLYSLFELLGL